MAKSRGTAIAEVTAKCHDTAKQPLENYEKNSHLILKCYPMRDIQRSFKKQKCMRKKSRQKMHIMHY